MQLTTLIALLPVVLAAPAAESGVAPLLKRGNHNGKYIVKLKETAGIASGSSAMSILSSEPEHVYTNVLNGFSARMDQAAVDAMRRHPDVEYVEESGIARALGYVTQSGATWGLARSSSKKAGAKDYTYDDSAGEGTCVYVIDTGVDDAHSDFGGRAKQLKSWINGSNKDDHGHGTHCAGTIGSKTWGIAKKTTIFGFKVLASNGSGDDDGVIAAIDEVAKDAPNRNCPKGVAVNLSLGTGFKMQSMNDAVARLVKANIFVAAAAGNSNKDAAQESPASEPTICTAGATDSRDQKASFSNYGSVVDIQAPGVSILSAAPGGRSMSGTSMASPHVAGMAAYLMAFEGVKGGAACDRIKALGQKGAAKGFPSGTTSSLLFNGNPKA